MKTKHAKIRQLIIIVHITKKKRNWYQTETIWHFACWI